MEAIKVLCVDDEPHVLSGLTLHLRRHYEVVVATSGPEGLEKISSQGPFAVALSDMRMPLMDGAAFLKKAREVSPETTRMLLTGQTDIESAIKAVNEGQVFRFLTKPCPPDQLRMAFAAGVEQYRLVTAERVLLEKTLRGSIQILVDILSMTNPEAFGRATRIKRQVRELAEAVGMDNCWQVEVAALLSQIGCLSLPDETARKFYNGQELTADENRMVAQIPSITQRILAHIPRLESVCEILAKQNEPLDKVTGSPATALGAKILRIVTDFDHLESRGLSVQMALDTLQGRTGRYDPQVLQTFSQLKGAPKVRWIVKDVPISSVRLGMVFAEDVHIRVGTLLVARGYEVTESFLEKMRNFPKDLLSRSVRVVIPGETERPAQ